MSARDNLDSKNVPPSNNPTVRKRNRISDVDGYGAFDEPQPPVTPTMSDPKVNFYGFKRKKPLRFMKTRDISSYFDRETYLKSFLNELMIFLGFIFTLTILTNASTTAIEYFYSKVITGLFIKKQFMVSEGQRISFNDITVLDMIWPYVDQVLLDNFYNRYWYYGNNTKGELSSDDANILYENKLIGLPRMRQVRIRNDSCVIPDLFKHMFKACYAEYSHGSEDKSPYGLGNNSAWQYTDEEVLGSHKFSGLISTYGGGGYFMDFNITKDLSQYTLKILKKHMWLDRGSRLVIIDFALYNANINYFCFVQIVFELLPTGAVLPTYNLEILRFHRHINYWDYILLVFQTIFVAYVIYYIFEELYEIIYFRWHYFKSFWNWLDMILIALSCTCIPLYAYLYLYTQHNLLRLINAEDSHSVFDELLLVKALHVNTLDILCLLCWFKLLKYLSLNQSMYQMQTTLARASVDILSYSVIFFTVIFAFAQLGHLLFGSEVRDFRTLTKSVFSLLRTIVGDFNYQAIEHAHHVLGPLYFFAYIFFIFFILVNMFLAIIIDTYSQVNNELSAAGAQLQVNDLIGRWINNLLRRIGCSKLAASRELRADEEFARATYQDIRNLLHKCGFSELEIDLFFAKYEITEDKLINPDNIRRLLANLENLPVSVQPDTRPPVEFDSQTEEFTKRVEILEDAVLAANTKIDIILNKVDDMMETQMGRKTQVE